MFNLRYFNFFDTDFERLLVVHGFHGGGFGRHVEYSNSLVGKKKVKLRQLIWWFIAVSVQEASRYVLLTGSV